MAAQPAPADWEWNYYHDYNVRVNNLPPVYATQSRRLNHNLMEMLQKLHKSTNRVGPDH